MKMVYYLGIDPGKGGGLVLLNRDGGVESCLKMPPTEEDLWNFFDAEFPINDVNRTFAFIEWIHPAIFGIGKSSMSKLYGNYMQLRGFLIATATKRETIKPRAWQQGLGISPHKKTENQTQWKNRLKSKARELFPSEKITLATADAFLIAEYGRRKDQGKL